MFDAVILMAGKGTRSGLQYNKILYKLNNKAVFLYSLEEFLKCDECKKVVLVIDALEESEIRNEINIVDERITFAYGGSQRQDSVRNGIKECSSEVILIHDAARPLIKKQNIIDVYENAKTHTSSVLAVKTIDTIKEYRDGKLITLNRDNLYNIQTPQGVNSNKFKEAHKLAEKENFYATDDVSLLEKYYNISPKIVIGSYNNLKLTTKEDLKYIEYLLKENN